MILLILKNVFTPIFITQKLDYIHNNPFSGKWMLTDSPENYLHSSAKFCFTGEQGIFFNHSCSGVDGFDFIQSL